MLERINWEADCCRGLGASRLGTTEFAPDMCSGDSFLDSLAGEFRCSGEFRFEKWGCDH